LRFRGVVYRAHNPKWSFSPVSGEGASQTGGRFNPKGKAAFYAALTNEGMFKEATQGFARKFDPLTVCSYEVDCEDILDLRSEAERAAHKVALSNLGCAWKKLAHDGEAVPSWLFAERLIASGKAGILTPSFAPGATFHDINLVLWDWGDSLPHQITVHDPDRRLPKNMSSWS